MAKVLITLHVLDDDDDVIEAVTGCLHINEKQQITYKVLCEDDEIKITGSSNFIAPKKELKKIKRKRVKLKDL